MANIKSTGVLGDQQSDGGLMTGVSMGNISKTNNGFSEFHEDFGYVIADGEEDRVGLTRANVGAATAVSVARQVARTYLLINGGTGNSEGIQLQHDAASIATATAPEIRGVKFSTAPTNMWGRELILKARVGFTQVTAGWNSTALIGFHGTDATLLTTGGVQNFTAEGVGFLVKADSSVWAYTFTGGAGYTEVDTGHTLPAVVATASLPETTNLQHWTNFGFRSSINTGTTIDAGVVKFYIDGIKVAEIVDATPFTISDASANGASFAVVNAAASRSADIGIDYLFTALTNIGAGE